MSDNSTNDLPLGKQVSYSSQYDPSLLFPIERTRSRETAGIPLSGQLWYGEDIWNIYELSWLDSNGKPQVAIGEIRIGCSSPFLVESKSMKLYFNSFNMSRFESAIAVQDTIKSDLSRVAGIPVNVNLIEPPGFARLSLVEPKGLILDEIMISDVSYQVNPELLCSAGDTVEEQLFSRLFRSCCPVTGQPDWATVLINYSGPAIHHEGLLRYLVSYREHTGFHEACVEKIFHDIHDRCHPDQLEVSARFTRRGGIDINPIRSTQRQEWSNHRDPRQ